jgi:LysR family transcriptional regulator, glycine cleavage system transcriptional activator
MIDVRRFLTPLRAFEAAARHSSIHKAAEELSVTDGAISRQVRHLEESLGVTLFERSNRSIRINPTAADFAATISDAFASIARGADQLKNRQSPTLVIAAPGTFLLRWLLPRLHDLEVLLDGISPRVTTWNKDINLLDRSVDIFIGAGALPALTGARAAKIGPETYGPVLSPRLLAEGCRGDRDLLWSLPRLDARLPTALWAAWASDACFQPPPKETIWFDRLFLALQAAEAGFGVAIGPGPAVADAITDGKLVAPLGLLSRPGCWHLVWREDRSQRLMTKIARWFEAQMA